MSVDVFQLTIHYLALDEQQAPQIRERQALIPTNAQVCHLLEQLHLSYNGKPAKGYARFSSDKSPLMQESMELWLQQPDDFMQLAKTATAELVKQLTEHQLAESGYLLISHYRYLATDYLLLCLLGSKEHFSVTAELDLAAAKHLDIARMQLAARIDLTEYQLNREHPHAISFIRGRAGRKVADFFLDFLGCEEGSDAKENSKQMLSSVEEYLSAAEFDPAEKSQVRQQVYQYCEEQSKQGQDVVLKELSEAMDPDDQHGFLHYCAEQQLAVAEQFPVEVKSLKPLVKFSGAGAGVSVSFEQKHLGERVVYDPQQDILTIRGVPPNLKDQLQRFLTGSSQ
ncbi:nucleoid-associated protein YejK [Alkalimonas sp. MEB108]|uniref:Nucleoid-associated protein YejK n=1 Tax=Alkalimonas cellulosilytica TaxID=3058395 RepID=A0ABU7J4L0_9GAMM|nr:nucleoid-associated protein YejK [Alkalimonas sp. MEB108]MEE2001307.1 nucleoid-associated protein YejK [Alkalimonas sp. MEB108]